MPVKREPSGYDPFEMLAHQVKALQSQIDELRNNAYPTLPVYNYDNLPSDPIEGQQAIIVNAPDTGGSGIMFDTDPQTGGWLLVKTTGGNPSTNLGIYLEAANWLRLRSTVKAVELISDASDITLDADSDIVLTSQDSGGDQSQIAMGGGSGGISIVSEGSGGVVLRLYNSSSNFTIRNASNNVIFRILQDGTIHGKTGAGPIVFDL